MSPRALDVLDRTERRRAVTASVLRCAISAAAIMTLYFLLPLDRGPFDSGALLSLVAGGILFAASLGWQLRRIAKADLPQLRAMEAMAVVAPLFIFMFSVTYLVLSNIHPGSFNQRLDHVSSLYFTVVTLGTVGYGDITPKTDIAELVVAGQIVLDLVLIAFLARVIFGMSKRSLQRSEDAPGETPS